jgi:YD repeat-containing protein
MSYDNAGRMTHWQDKPTSPSHQQDLAYDGEGNRVAQHKWDTCTQPRRHHLQQRISWYRAAGNATPRCVRSGGLKGAAANGDEGAARSAP